jgi:hypothetical protein
MIAGPKPILLSHKACRPRLTPAMMGPSALCRPKHLQSPLELHSQEQLRQPRLQPLPLELPPLPVRQLLKNPGQERLLSDWDLVELLLFLELPLLLLVFN